ncbi:MAG: hypothetical protein PQJ46_16945 [Spirochaetales bacterium]|nr:hypothetical protein [Spirochaetales bacterium]
MIIRNSRKFLLLLLLILITGNLFAENKKLRFSGTGGLSIQNELLGQELTSNAAVTGGAGFAIAYPVSSIEKLMNVELSISNWYNVFPYQERYAQSLRFGFGIRVFCNAFNTIRPYFTHDITSCVLWVSDRDNYASSYGILLGLGIDVPLPKKYIKTSVKRTESSSIFFDISYNTFKVGDFTSDPEKISFISASAGFSWLLPQKKKATT